MERKQMPPAPTKTISLGNGIMMSITKEIKEYNQENYAISLDRVDTGQGCIKRFLGRRNVSDFSFTSSIKNGEVTSWQGYLQWDKKAKPKRVWVGESYLPHQEGTVEEALVQQKMVCGLNDLLKQHLTTEMKQKLSDRAKQLFREWVEAEITYLQTARDDENHVFQDEGAERLVPQSQQAVTALSSNPKTSVTGRQAGDLPEQERKLPAHTEKRSAVLSPQGLPAPNASTLPMPRIA